MGKVTPTKKRMNFVLSEEAYRIIETQSNTLGINKTSVIELALRAFQDKDGKEK